MQNMLINMLLGKLQAQNPQQANQIRQMMSSNTNPQDILKQMMGSMDTSQMEQVLNVGKQMGVPNDVLSQVQNMK